jgi:hypothetical protein
MDGPPLKNGKTYFATLVGANHTLIDMVQPCT